VVARRVAALVALPQASGDIDKPLIKHKLWWTLPGSIRIRSQLKELFVDRSLSFAFIPRMRKSTSRSFSCVV